MNKLELELDIPQLHTELTSQIIGCFFEVMNEMGVGFLETVYKNALFFALKEKGLVVQVERSFDVYFKEKKVGLYKADLIVENSIIIELKCCACLLAEHQAQLINYLKATNIPIGLLVNFGNKKVDYRRLTHPSIHPGY